MTVYFTIAALIKLFGLDLDVISCFFEIFLLPYQVTIDPPFELAKNVLGSMSITIPNFVRDLIVLWIALGRIVRKAISDISAEIEEKSEKYNSQPKQPLTEKIIQFIKKPVGSIRDWFKKPVVKEGIVATLFWPYRLWVDLKGDYVTYREYVDGQQDPIEVKKFEQTIYWSLSPKKVLIYLAVSFLLLGALVILNSHITIGSCRR